MVGDFGGSLERSLSLAFIVMGLTVLIALCAGLAFRRKFYGATALFYLTVASLIVPSILISLGIGLLFNVVGIDPAWYSSALGAHLTWTLPFGVLIMLAVFNRFNKSLEEASRDLGASPWQTFVHVVLPLILPSLIGVGLFGFTLSYDEFARTIMAAGTENTLPLEIFGMTTNVTTPVLYALGSVTTLFSFALVVSCAAIALMMRRKRVAA
jgi:putative spermidine/putrescine transport system permease protein